MLSWLPLRPLFRPFVSLFILLRTPSQSCCSSNNYLIPILVACLIILCAGSLLVLDLMKRRRANLEFGAGIQQHEEADVFSSRRARRSMSSTSTSTVVRRYSGPQPVPFVVGRAQRASDSGGNPDPPSHHYPPSIPPIDTGFSRSPLFPNTPLYASPTVGLPDRGGLRENAFISPLPSEILLQIFRYAFPRHDRFPQISTPFPFPLRRVCRRWRDIIDEAPEFWLSLRPPLNSSKCTPPVANWYGSVIANLSEKITSFDHVVIDLPREEDTVHWNLFQCLLPFVKKSTAVKMVGHSFALNHVALQSIFSHVEVTVRRKQSDGPELEHLRSVEWSMPYYHFQHCFPQSLNLPWTSLRALPWSQLTSVTLDMRMTLHDCVFIFDHATSMERLVLEKVSDHSADILFSEDVTHSLSCLHSLAIAAEVNLSTLFRKYPMPQLRELSLKLDGRDTGTELHQLAVPWRQLTHVAIDCFLPVEVAENIVHNLELVETLFLKGTLVGDGNWSVHKLLPSLRSFTLYSNNDIAGSATATHFTQHVFPPSVEVINIPLIPSTIGGIVPQPFGSLQEVQLSRSICPSDFFFFLSLTKNLRHGKFTIRDTEEQLLLSPSSPPLIPPAPPTLPPPNFLAIKSLVVSLDLDLHFQDTPAELFLDALTLPNLTSLTFKATRSSSNHKSLVDLLRRSQCRAKKLSLDYPSLGSEQVLEIMELFNSSLEDFTVVRDVYYGRYGEDVFRQLTHVTDNPMGCLCPRLKRLHIRPCMDSGFFFDMVMSRSDFADKCATCGGVEKLEFVGASFAEDCHYRDAWERELKELGIAPDLEVW